MAVSKKIHFEFAEDVVKQPLLYHLSKRFDVVMNIRAASVHEKGGFIALELEGDEPEVQKVLDYLAEIGVSVAEGLGGADEATS